MDHERSESGVDVTLIDEMLRLTPQQRLEMNDRMLASVAKFRRAFGLDNGPDETGRDPRRLGG